MSRFSKVRGKGRKDEEIERLREENEALRRAAPAPADPAPADAEQAAKPAPVKPSKFRIKSLAFKRYLDEGGEELDRCIRNAGMKCEIFASQVNACAHGNPDGGWGPNITPYEDRMNCSLQSRMLKQRGDWMARCRHDIEEEIEAGESGEAPPEQQPQQQPEPPKAPPSMPSDEAWQQAQAWLAEPDGPVPFSFPQVMAYVRSLEGNYEHCSPLVSEVARTMEDLGRRVAEEHPDLMRKL